MMLGRAWRPVTTLLSLLFLTQTSCCTTLGYKIGDAIDGEVPSPQSDALVRAGRVYAGRAVEVTTQDGRVIVGERETNHDLTRPELRELYLGLADRSSSAPRLPLPGDTILVSTGARRGWMRFDRFAELKPRPGAVLLDTTGAIEAVFDLADIIAPMNLPWSSIVRLQWADSTRLDDPRLLLPVLAKIPLNPRIVTVATESGAREEFRSWEVARVETIHTRPATTVGTLTGLGFDFLLMYLAGHYMYGGLSGVD
jgi:hypothetical protein